MQRRYRLCRRADFTRLRRHGRRFAHPLAVLITCQSELEHERYSSGSSRFAFSASRRIGNAVKRNRAKRLLREAVRLNVEKIKPGWDCLFIARAATPQADFIEVEAAVLQLLKRAGLLEKQES